MKLFRASQSSVVHIEAVLTSNQSPVWPAKNFQRFIDTVVCKRCLSRSFRHGDLLCKKIIQKQFLLWYFNCFLSNDTVGCCNINFSCQSQIRRENFASEAMSLYFWLYFFWATAVVSMPRLANFSSCDPLIFDLAPLFILRAYWKTNFFLMFMGNYWERNRERQKFRLNRFPIVEAKSNLLYSSALKLKHFFAVPASHRWEAI